MTEAKDGLLKPDNLSIKGGERINPRWGSGEIPESEPTHYDLLRERAAERRRTTGKDAKALKPAETPESPPSPSRKPLGHALRPEYLAKLRGDR